MQDVPTNARPRRPVPKGYLLIHFPVENAEQNLIQLDGMLRQAGLQQGDELDKTLEFNEETNTMTAKFVTRVTQFPRYMDLIYDWKAGGLLINDIERFAPDGKNLH